MTRNLTNWSEEQEEEAPLTEALPIPFIEQIRTFIFFIARNSNALIEHSTVFVNIFHLLILFQKTLRTNSIFILMIGICISDILGFLVLFYYLGVDRKNYKRDLDLLRHGDYPPYELLCLPCCYTYINLVGVLKTIILNSTRPISIWLAILMAMVRTLSIIFPMSTRISKLTRAGSAILMVLVVCVSWIVYYSWDLVFLEVWWYPDKVRIGCFQWKLALQHEVYLFVYPNWKYDLMSERDNYEYLVRLIPALFYPFLTVSLLIELCRIRKKRKTNKMGNEKSDNTTVLILFMTLSFMLSEGLEGISSLDISHWSEAYANFM
ncbi:unnamed protein product [Caenorhabditis brenneri]